MSNTTSSSGSHDAVSAMTEESRKAMSSAFDAMTKWRHDLASMTERNSEAAFGQMSSAAKALGWPTEFVEATSDHMRNASKMQLQMMDQVMGVWEKQAKSPAAGFQMPQMPTFPGMPAFPGMPNFPGMPSFPGFGATNGSSGAQFPGMPDMSKFPMMQMMPMQFWMQAFEMWQKSWQQGMQTWMDAQSSMMNKAASPLKPGQTR